jgi:hypothetical protein
MAQPTPGPWEIEQNGRARLDISAPENQCGGYLIATMNPHAPCKEANARLIAAAPDLFAALKALYAFASDMVMQHGPNGDDSMTDEQHRAWQDAAGDTSVAIAKAEGR